MHLVTGIAIISADAYSGFFFTAKDVGSGIGLLLARQITEAHGGSVQLTNREGSRGATALVRTQQRLILVGEISGGDPPPRTPGADATDIVICRSAFWQAESDVRSRRDQ